MPARVAMALQADGWWLRSEIIWHKPNPMPESVTDRPTNSHEKVFLLSKSGDKLFWTHRAYDGVRSLPAPDSVWRNRDASEETPIEPAGWRETPSQKDPKQKMWQRVNLWVGHDYFYDAEAVRGAMRYSHAMKGRIMGRAEAPYSDDRHQDYGENSKYGPSKHPLVPTFVTSGRFPRKA